MRPPAAVISPIMAMLVAEHRGSFKLSPDPIRIDDATRIHRDVHARNPDLALRCDTSTSTTVAT